MAVMIIIVRNMAIIISNNWRIYVKSIWIFIVLLFPITDLEFFKIRYFANAIVSILKIYNFFAKFLQNIFRVCHFLISLPPPSTY